MVPIEGPANRPPSDDFSAAETPSAGGSATRTCTGRGEAFVSDLVITPKREAETLVLALAGDLDIASVPVLERQLDDALAARGRRVVIDLTDLEFLDSTGLALFLTARQRLYDRGQDFCLRRPRPAVQRLFELTHTMELFQFES
ncbi:MAG TPA: STAS domain-containing protein [Solirubrobacteraceae bacterium]|nr:STAS domain-containing protein [Solirubrobacteraceae bacterium]